MWRIVRAGGTTKLHSSGRAPSARPQECGTVGRVEPWDVAEPSVLRLPSGRLVRGRGLRHGAPDGVRPAFGLYLLAKPPQPMAWPSRWVRWPDWWLPRDRADARDAVLDVWRRAESERVEIACGGGRGRTGTALACLSIVDGVPPADAVGYVRRHYHPRAVETPWQRRYVRHFDP